MQRVVISGAGGLVGTNLSAMLAERNFEVVCLTRSRSSGSRNFLWDPDSAFIEEGAFAPDDIIIHLAGANIGSRRWTNRRKEEIIKSRVDTARLIHLKTIGAGIKPKAFITASAIGYYGSAITSSVFTENDPPSTDFLGSTCSRWEASAALFEPYGVRVVRIRTAVVMAARGSALTKLLLPSKAGLIIRIGPGNQYFPWIHIKDLCSVYLKATNDDNMTGAFNAVAPDHITIDELMAETAGQKNLPVFLPRIPEWFLRLTLGERSVILTTGSRVSCEKLLSAGFSFSYPDIGSALKAC